MATIRQAPIRPVGSPSLTSDRTARTPTRAAAAGTEDEWGRMHAALTAWKATSLLRQAARELDRGLADDVVSGHVSDQFQRAAENARTAAAALDELDEYLHARAG